MTHPHRILHLITGLNRGGAEMMLYKLLSSMNRQLFKPVVITLVGKGDLEPQIEELDVPLYSLGLNRSSLPTPLSLGHLLSFIRKCQPDIIQGWMPHANLASLLVRWRLPKQIPILWNIRQSLYDLRSEKRSSAFLIRLGAYLSKYPSRIIYNSQTGAYQHEAIGYSTQKRQVIPNGFNCEIFRPDPSARLHLHRDLGLESQNFLIGRIGNYHPMKDYNTFIQAAGQLANHRNDVHFILVGRGITYQNQLLQEPILAAGLKGRFHLLGERTDIPNITAGLDIATSSSWTEGFPNVVGEAMACGLPCVVTDVGDSAWLVGDTGEIIPPRDVEALVMAWSTLIDAGVEKRIRLGKAARRRIQDHFSLASITQQYETLYQEVLAEAQRS